MRRGDCRFPRRTLGVVKVTLGVGVEVQHKFVVVGGDDRVIVEILIKIGLVVIVEVLKPCDLVAPGNIDFAIGYLHPQWLK